MVTDLADTGEGSGWIRSFTARSKSLDNEPDLQTLIIACPAPCFRTNCADAEVLRNTRKGTRTRSTKNVRYVLKKVIIHKINVDAKIRF